MNTDSFFDPNITYIVYSRNVCVYLTFVWEISGYVKHVAPIS